MRMSSVFEASALTAQPHTLRERAARQRVHDHLEAMIGRERFSDRFADSGVAR